MATIAPVRVNLLDVGYAQLYRWESLTEADTATAIKASSLADKAIQVTGNFGTSGDVHIEGSMDGVSFAQLNDPQGDAISLTSAGIVQIQENAVFIRPVLDAGTGVDVDIYLLAR